ncbi:MAG: hypothetical protein ACP5NX_03525 [Candidatus Bilamarchaeaceae archaeon]
MVEAKLRMHPDVLVAYGPHHADLIVRAENHSPRSVWAECDVHLGKGLSLSPDTELLKGRARIGILGKNQFIEKRIKIYANKYTQPRMYPCEVVVFSFDKNAVIEQRVEKGINIRCELNRKATL